VLLVTAVLLPVVLFLVFRSWQHLPGSTRSEATSVAPPSPAPAQAAPVDRTARPALPSEPLPPADVPISDVATLLQSRADAGDSLAACRLALELLRCDQIDASLSKFDDSERALQGMESAGMLEHAKGLADQLSWQIAREKECRALPPDLRGKSAHYLTQAARAGEPEAMLHYAEAAHLGNLEGLALYRAAEFDAWRRDAPGMLHRALQAGRGEAVQMLRLAYQGDYGPLSSLFENDPVEAQAYLLMFTRMVGGTEQIDTALDPQQLARARELADDRYRRYLASRPPEAGPLQPFLIPPGQGSESAKRSFCGDG
jgi:hypothetical protein